MPNFSCIKIAILAIFTILSGCDHRLPTYRYRLKAEVDTPQGLKIGSSVIQVRSYIPGALRYLYLDWDGINQMQVDIEGDAVSVEISPGQTLFLLLKNPGNWGGPDGYIPSGAYPNLNYENGSEELKKYKENIRSKTESGLEYCLWNRGLKQAKISYEYEVKELYHCEIEYYDRPELVKFDNIDEPWTVREVDPKHLDKSFGSGVSLRRITVQITKDDVTRSIERKLPWLIHIDESTSLGSGNHQQNMLANWLNKRAFERRYSSYY